MSLVLNACRNYTLKINIEIYSYHVKQKLIRSIITFKIPFYFQSDMYVEHLTLYV